MFKLAIKLGLLKDYDLNKVDGKEKSKKKPFFKSKKSSDNFNQPNNPSGIPKPKFRWKPFIWTAVILGIISIILYLIFGLNRSTNVVVQSANVQNVTISEAAGATNDALLLSDKNKNKFYVELNPSKIQSVSLITENRYQIYTQSIRVKENNYKSSESINFQLEVVRSNDANGGFADRYILGSTSVVSFASAKAAAVSRSSTAANLTESIQILQPYNLNNSTAATQAQLKDLFTYLSSAANRAAPVTQSLFLTIFIQLLPLLLWGFLIFFIFRAMSGRQANQEGIFGVGKSSAKNIKTNITFKDVAGIQEEKDELIEIVDYLRNPGKYAAMGARTPRGIILYGPPGTGKTLLAKAVSGEADVPFFEVSGASFDDMFVGVGAKRVRDLFMRAKKSAPCIIFIDEIDAVAGKRGSRNIAGSSGGIADQTINQLLSEMDGFNTSSGIIIMAATNRLDSLDEAILRPGRFDRHIQVNLPDIRERVEILKIHAKNKNLSSKIILEDVARRTPGFSGAQLENVLNEATILTVRGGKHIIGLHEIDEAIDRVMAGPAKKSRRTTYEERKQIAYHEAGHALAGLYVRGGDVVEKITIIPRGQAAGYTLSAPEKQELLLRSKENLLSIITTTLAGRASEEIIYGPNKITSGASNDFYKVTNIVRSMVTQLGMSKLGLTQYIPSEGEQNPYVKYYSEQTAREIDNEINQIINKQYEQAKKIICQNRLELDLIVECLLLMETIVKPQIDYIHKYHKLPQEAIETKRKLEAKKEVNSTNNKS